jgi:hypothetical protein
MGTGPTSENKTDKTWINESDFSEVPRGLFQMPDREQQYEIQPGGACHPKWRHTTEQRSKR